MVEDVARDDHHNHESRDEEQWLPHVAGKQRARGEDDGRDASDDGGREADDESVTAAPMPMMSRMMKSIGRRMGVKSVSRLTKRAVDPMTNQTFPITRSTNVRPRPRWVFRV